MKRALAEMENVRTRTAREMDTAKKFAVQVRRGAAFCWSPKVQLDNDSLTCQLCGQLLA
jgi:hypothetical protein